MHLTKSSIQESRLSIHVLNGFDDARISEKIWMHLLEKGATESVNMTWRWQKTWWENMGHGQLLLILAEKKGCPIAIAPFFTDGGMIYNICPEDHLDFIGDISDSDVLDAIITTAKSEVVNFKGFQFYFIPDYSSTPQLLKAAADRLNFICENNGEISSPWLNIEADPETAYEMTRKKSLRRHENYFVRNGHLEIFHFSKAEEILPLLDQFFKQHIERRATTNAPSIFVKPDQKEYYRRLTEYIGPTGWLRFTRIQWNNQPIAFHYGLSYKGRYLYGIPSFDIALSDHSPGEVLLRQVLLAALNEHARSFDFGIGDEAYKSRFSTHNTTLYNWTLYPLEK